MNDNASEDRRAWSPPVLTVLGETKDTRFDAGGDVDLDGLNEDPVFS